jgi:hypothetical protein
MYNFWFTADVAPAKDPGVTATLGLFKPHTPQSVSVTVPGPGVLCPSDVFASGEVDINDLLAVVNAWGANCIPCPPSCSADIDGDCDVDVDDLLLVVNNWGPCD